MFRIKFDSETYEFFRDWYFRIWNTHETYKNTISQKRGIKFVHLKSVQINQILLYIALNMILQI